MTGEAAESDTGIAEDSFFASVRTLKALVLRPQSPGDDNDKKKQQPRFSSATTETARLSEALKVLRAKLSAAEAAQQGAARELQQEQSRREALEQAHQDTVQDLQSKIELVQGALRQEISLRLSVEKAHQESTKQLGEKLKEAQEQLALEKARNEDKVIIQELQSKLQAAQAAAGQEQLLRVDKEKELEEQAAKMSAMAKELGAAKTADAANTSAPAKTGETPATPQGKRQVQKQEGPHTASPSNFPLLQDKIAQLKRENENLQSTAMSERQKHLQEMDRILQQEQSALSQRDSLAARLAGSEKVMAELRAQLAAAVEETTDKDRDLLEESYKVIVDNLKKQVS